MQQYLTDEVLNRGKKSICLDLKQEKQRNILKRLLKTADVLLDPYRPGVLENLKLSPVDLQKDNGQLIIARLTGYGQPRHNDSVVVGQQRLRAGHDINYVALSGLLSTFGGAGCHNDGNSVAPPHVAPMNIIGDFAGGGLSCAFAVVLALLARQQTGLGQIIDNSMTASIAYIASFVGGSKHKVPMLWPNPANPGCNVLDGGAPFYRCYVTADNRSVAVGALEPRFYACLLKVLGIPESEAPQFDYATWPNLSKRFAGVFKTKTQIEWIDKANLAGDCCLTAVLELDEAAEFWGDSFMHTGGTVEPKPQPIFSNVKEVGDEKLVRPKVGEHTREVLQEIGCGEDEISEVLQPLSPNM